jgi:hypothetical protein
LKLQLSKFETSTFDDLVFGATGATEASGEDVVALIVVRYKDSNQQQNLGTPL